MMNEIAVRHPGFTACKVSNVMCRCGRKPLLILPSGNIAEMCGDCAIEHDTLAYEAVIRKTWEDGLVEKEYRYDTWETYQIYSGKEQQTVFDNIKKWSDNFTVGQCAIWVGGQGTGKGFFAARVRWDLAHRGFKTKMVIASQVYQEYLEAQKEGYGSKLAQSLLNYDLLIIDEIGHQSTSDAESRFFRNEIHLPLENKVKSLLLISNKPKPKGIDLLFDADRISDKKKWSSEAFTWASKRGQE